MTETISLDAGVRMNRIPALGLWDTVNDVLFEPIAQGDVLRKQKQKNIMPNEGGET